MMLTNPKTRADGKRTRPAFRGEEHGDCQCGDDGQMGALVKVIIPEIASGILSGFVMAITLSLDDYFVATYTKPATFDTISTYVVNATKGSQTEIKTALWALSTIIFLVVVVVELVLNLAPAKKAAGEETEIDE